MKIYNFWVVITLLLALVIVLIDSVNDKTNRNEDVTARIRLGESPSTTRKNENNRKRGSGTSKADPRAPPMRSALFKREKKTIVKRDKQKNETEKELLIITKNMVKSWAEEISEKLREHEERVLHRTRLLKDYADVKLETRNGSAIADKMAKVFQDILERRAEAAESIMRKAEELAKEKTPVPTTYMFNSSKNLGEDKPLVLVAERYETPLNCTRPQHVNLNASKHFDANINLEISSAQVAREVFDCDPHVLEALYWSEGLVSTFRQNYAKDASLAFQYFCSAKGFLRHYPGASWESMASLVLDGSDDDAADVYDCRLRSWYVGAGGAPRDVLVLVDATGSMANSSNNVIAEQLTLAILSALTDDDYVNVLRFNTKIRSPIDCFNDKLVPANHVNSAAMMAAMKEYEVVNDTNIEDVLEYAVRLLQRQRGDADHPVACQQAIVILADSIYTNASQKMMDLDPEGHIRLFVMWLHDRFGLQDDTFALGDWLSCARDGIFAELVTANAVTQHVMNILRVLERPLVAQRKRRLKVFSDMYAHLEDPRKGEYHWWTKERAEQIYRYQELRIHKDKLLNDLQLMKDYVGHQRLEQSGHYYEGEDLKYRFQISVAVPVFDYTTLENITIQLAEEKQRNATRQYPVNRLLGVAGVDIPLDHLKLLLPYHELGPGGTLFIADHRGNIVLHENLKPTFDGDILKPGYRTIDVLEIELPGHQPSPRRYPRAWKRFRDDMIISERSGNRIMHAKYVYENHMRAHTGNREYHWRRVLEHYTAAVALPEHSRKRTTLTKRFTPQLADEALRALDNTEFSIHPDWLYCRHIEQYWDPRENEFLHFLRWRRNDTNFAGRDLHHFYSPLPPTPYDMPYQCDMDLMGRVCRDAVATASWARAHREPGTQDCGSCVLGSTTAFIAIESGLTRWHMYHSTSPHASPPEGSVWPRASDEPWYVRAACAAGTLVVHAPVTPVRHMRRTEDKPAKLGARAKWLTAARTLGQIGVGGFHFHPEHLDDLIEAITNFPCPEVEGERCNVPRCDHEDWECNLIDDAGWVVSEGKVETEKPIPEMEGVRKHFATKHPVAMAALLHAEVFKLDWIHDYQAVCFTKDEDSSGAASFHRSLVRTVWQTASLLVQLAASVFNFLMLFSTCSYVEADTKVEREKRQKRTRRDFQREKFERLYDPRVLVNRTRFAACDRTRAVYQLQPQNETSSKLNREVEQCTWPLVAARVPDTNLLLVAVLTKCDKEEWLKFVHDPLVNSPVDMTEGRSTPQRATEKLACWRNRTPLPGRPPNMACFPHNYTEEQGYRQCGPWQPDPEPEA